MISLGKLENLRDKVYKLLTETGFKIHSDELTRIAVKKGCTISPSGRIRIPRSIIDEMVEFQKTKQEQDRLDQQLLYHCGPDWAHHIIWRKQQDDMLKKTKKSFLMQAFDCGPTRFYDYDKQELVSVDTEIFIESKKFAQATPEIGYISTWYRSDVPAKTERLDSLVLGLKYTDKLDGIEAIYPEVIKYLVEASEIITGNAGDSSYLAGGECITAPLILGSRSAADILERKKCGVGRYHVATMPMIGISTPVTLASAVVLLAAETLGGMALCWCVDPGMDLSARALSLAMNMKTAQSEATGPESTVANLITKQLFDTFWGGQCWVETFFSPHVARPGLIAVCENTIGGWRAAKLLNQPEIPYPGMGTLGDGGIGSFEQFMLDMEIRKAGYFANDDIDVDDFPFEEYCEMIDKDGEFLSHEHTLANFKKLWSSNIIQATGELAEWDEKKMLDKCRDAWKENVAKWQGPQLPREKIKALEDMLQRAKKELL